MSATLDAEKVSAYFGDCPIIQVPGRTYPVDVKFLEDAVELTNWHISESSPYARRGGINHTYLCTEVSHYLQQPQVPANGKNKTGRRIKPLQRTKSTREKYSRQCPKRTFDIHRGRSQL